MKKKKTFGESVVSGIKKFFGDPLTIYILIVAICISGVILLEPAYPHIVEWTVNKGFVWLEKYLPYFAIDGANGDKEFSRGFVEWFGTFYGFLLPLLLVRAWEQLDSADREFDREADAIKVLLQDFMLLDDDDFLPFKLKMVCRLHIYCRHVLKRYQYEHKPKNVYLKIHGNNLLHGIRIGYKKLIYRGGGKRASQLEPVTTELLQRLNDAIDTRGDRIAIFGQRLFESMRMVAIITSVVWLIPFYFLPFETGVFGASLKLAVTFLIIFVLSIIDDLDQPFTGVWQIHTQSWQEVHDESKKALEDLNAVYQLKKKKRQNSLFEIFFGKFDGLK